MKDHRVTSFEIPERFEIIDDLPFAGDIEVDKKKLRQDIKDKLSQEGIIK